MASASRLVHCQSLLYHFKSMISKYFLQNTHHVYTFSGMHEGGGGGGREEEKGEEGKANF